MCPHTAICPHTTIHVSSYYCICVLILLYARPRTAICVLLILCVLILLYMCPHTSTCVLLLYVSARHLSSYCYTCVLLLLYVSSYHYTCVLMRIKRPTNAYEWHTWVLRKVRDVCAVVQFGKLDGNHLSMMLSLVSRDPALWRGEGT
jgi:hypothetical protein